MLPHRSLLLLAASFFTLPLALVSCSDDDDPAATGGTSSGGTSGGTSSGGTSGGSSGGSSGGTSGGGTSSGNPGVPSSYTCKRELHVSPTGNDANAGTDPAQPLKTISDSTKKAEPGDCIKVHTGTYAETKTITFPKDGTQAEPIVLWASDGRGTAVIDAKGNRGLTVLISQDFIIIDGFEFKNTPTDTGEQVIKIDGKDAGKGRGTAIRNNKVTGGHDHLKINERSVGVTVEGNEFYGTFGHIPISLTGASSLMFRNNFCHDWDVGGDGAVQIKGGSADSVFDGNRFQDVKTAAGTIALGDSCEPSCDIDPEHWALLRAKAINNVMVRVGRAFDVQGCKDCAILNNTIVDSGKGNVLFKLTKASTGGVEHTSEGTRILNNLVANPAGDQGNIVQINAGSGTGLAMDFNLIWNGAGNVSWGDGHPTSADANSILRQDPKFAGADDFNLGAGSPAAAKGQNLAADVPHDFAGTARPASGNFDIGAYQAK